VSQFYFLFLVLTRVLSGLLGLPDPTIIGWVHGTIKSCGGLVGGKGWLEIRAFLSLLCFICDHRVVVGRGRLHG
jgi:hypothetical protein